MSTVQRCFYLTIGMVLLFGDVKASEQNREHRKRERYESRSCSPEAQEFLTSSEEREQVLFGLEQQDFFVSSDREASVTSSVCAEEVKSRKRGRHSSNSSDVPLTQFCLKEDSLSQDSSSTPITPACTLVAVLNSPQAERSLTPYIPRSLSVSMHSEASTSRSIRQDSQEIAETQEDFTKEYYTFDRVAGCWRAKTFEEWKADLPE